MKNKKEDKEKAYSEIMHMFRYFYKDAWAPGHIFNGKTRLWISAFNDLRDKGLIMKRKKHPGYEYKWAGVWPERY